VQSARHVTDTDSNELRDRVADLEADVARLRQANRYRGVRKRSSGTFCGLPWYDVAFGPDPAAGDMQGHARGIIAIGDVATGVLALGGLARGVVALGGLALGGISFGGCSIGLLAAIGGFAVGGLAFGGGAVGLVAIGGGALGYYALGGGAVGEHVIDSMQRDPEAVRLFQQFAPGLEKLFGGR
jgi:hypothetical protein